MPVCSCSPTGQSGVPFPYRPASLGTEAAGAEVEADLKVAELGPTRSRPALRGGESRNVASKGVRKRHGRSRSDSEARHASALTGESDEEKEALEEEALLRRLEALRVARTSRRPKRA